MKKTDKITIAPRDLIEEYSLEVDRILAILGFPEALVTDESDIGDFLIDPNMFEDKMERTNEEAHNAALIDRVSELCGNCEITLSTKLVDAAKNVWHYEGEIRY